MTTHRIAPLLPPYAEEIQHQFDVVMPPGMEPLKLFRTIAHSPRILKKFMRAGVLDRGPVAIRDRELLIHRTCARCDSRYEWGVHASAFGQPLGFSDDLLTATVQAGWDDPLWTPAQAALVRLCDELHDTATITDACWAMLQAHFPDEQILEFIYTVGVYHTVAFLTNALEIELEDIGAPYPAGG